MKKLYESKQVFHYLQNNNEFLSIVFIINSSELNAFISVENDASRASSTKMEKKIKSILNARRVFADGSSFKTHFNNDMRLGMEFKIIPSNIK